MTRGLLASAGAVVRRRWWLLLLPFVVSVIVLLVLASDDGSWRAEATVRAPGNAIADGVVGRPRADADPAGEIRDLAASAAPSAARVSRDGDLVRVSFTARDADGARQSARGLAERAATDYQRRTEAAADRTVALFEDRATAALSDMVRDQRALNRLRISGATGSELERQAAAVEQDRSAYSAASSQLDEARLLAELARERAASTPVFLAGDTERTGRPPIGAWAAALLTAAAIVAAALVLIAERLDRTVRDEADVRDATGKRVLAVVEGS